MIGRFGPQDLGGTKPPPSSASSGEQGAAHGHHHDHHQHHHDHDHDHDHHHDQEEEDEWRLTEEDRAPRPLSLWEKRVDAMENLLVGPGRPFNVHMLRRGIESIDPRVYHHVRYYDRWTVAMCRLCVDRGLITAQDLQHAFTQEGGGSYPQVEEEEGQGAVLLSVGEEVRVCPLPGRSLPSWALTGHNHVRTPGYLLGKVGVVERVVGSCPSPELESLGIMDGPRHTLYRVRFRQVDVWGHYQGNSQDTIEVEVYGDWLRSVQREALADAANRAAAVGGHLSREEAEASAVAREAPPSAFERLANALLTALANKGLVALSSVQAHIDALDSALAPDAAAATIVAHAWQDPAFCSLLVSDPRAACLRLGIDIGGTRLVVLQNTPQVHHLVVCTLCSCYPRKVLGVPPDWYKSRKYRARAVSEPRQVLREFGLELPPDTSVKVHDSTAELRYLVLPQCPLPDPASQPLERLMGLVTRDCCIGVALPKTPPSPPPADCQPLA